MNRCWIYKENEVSYGIEEEGHDLSKKRLYEIAKELGKESKEVVARAKELGLDVKSHSSSVEEAVAAKIAASFKPAALKAEAKPAAQKQVQKRKPKIWNQLKPAVAKEEAKPAAPVAPKTEKQQLNHKVVISRLSVKPVPKSRQNDANKTRAITVTNNKTVTVRKTMAVMVENKVKATATIVV